MGSGSGSGRSSGSGRDGSVRVASGGRKILVAKCYCDEEVEAGEHLELVLDGVRLTTHITPHAGHWVGTSIYREGDQWSYHFHVIDRAPPAD